ncbi:MAG: BlaI/MecI/CopY family transcriptional regulator [bacterium]|nr:BlaI/MecI/CopY family transcriptional regulator [bacterium]
MKNDKLLNILKNIGLEQKEASVYLASLSLGPTSILRLARACDIKRTTIYGIVENLKQKGLISIEQKGLKHIYTPENPEKLELMLESRQSEFKNVLPEFLGLYKLKGEESVIKYYTGISKMQAIYRDSLKEIRPHEDYLVIANQEKWYNLDPKFAVSYIEERAKLDIKTRLLFQDSKIAREHKKFEKNFNQKSKILPIGTPLNVDTILLPKKMVVLELTPPYMTVVIENKSIVELHREMFEIIWRSIVE